MFFSYDFFWVFVIFAGCFWILVRNDFDQGKFCGPQVSLRSNFSSISDFFPQLFGQQFTYFQKLASFEMNRNHGLHFFFFYTHAPTPPMHKTELVFFVFFFFSTFSCPILQGSILRHPYSFKCLSLIWLPAGGQQRSHCRASRGCRTQVNPGSCPLVLLGLQEAFDPPFPIPASTIIQCCEVPHQ